MTQCTEHAPRRPDRGHRHRRVTVIALVVIGLAFGGCGVVKAIRTARRIVGSVQGNRATIDSFTSTIKSGEATPFEATYETTGSAPATVTYAVQPPTGLAFILNPAGTSDSNGSSVHLIVNSSGEYSCTASAGSGSGVTCQKLGAADRADENNIFDFYTPSHWVTFLQDFALAAGIAGDKVSSSTMTVNGFAMKCVDFVAPGVAGTSTICTTDQNILGYVKVASDSTSFEITNYTANPPSSLFELPPGATVTTST
jgi:hypothetical protein